VLKGFCLFYLQVQREKREKEIYPVYEAGGKPETESLKLLLPALQQRDKQNPRFGGFGQRL